MAQSSAWRSPSNIALIKYWGKYPGQIPANPSLSFTLRESFTETQLSLAPGPGGRDFHFELWLGGQKREDFKAKIAQFFERLGPEVDFLRGQRLEIHTENSFPHSSGIASSASGMSALALGLLSLKGERASLGEEAFWRKASQWSRLGSGSAARSVYGGLVEWGRWEGMAGSSDEYATPYRERLDPIFSDYCDYILLVETGQKKVSSTAGHALMQNHPFAPARFEQAGRQLGELLGHMAAGETEAFGALVESEALTLHAMMMSSRPYFILMKPATLSIIEKIWALREESGKAIYFTLDAGANIHLLFPASEKRLVESWLQTEVLSLLKEGRYIADGVGNGPLELS